MTRVFRTGQGWVGVAASEKGVTAVVGPRPDRAQVVASLRGEAATAPHPVLDQAVAQLTAYYSGRPVTFDVPLDLSAQPPFRRKVLLEAAKIPCGQTISYGELAERVGKPRAARAVGQAMAKNPVAPIVPCHRVIGADGSLVGFGGGVDMKARLLETERNR